MDRRIILAVAGSGKTTFLINSLNLDRRFLIVTYTENNGAVTITYDGMDNSLQGTWDGDVLNIKDSLGSDTIYNRK